MKICLCSERIDLLKGKHEHVDVVKMRLKYRDVIEQDRLAVKVRLYRKRAIKPYSRLHALRKQESKRVSAEQIDSP